jgi:hypothetical protein
VKVTGFGRGTGGITADRSDGSIGDTLRSATARHRRRIVGENDGHRQKRSGQQVTGCGAEAGLTIHLR